MNTSGNSINKAVTNDPYSVSSIEDFLTRLNSKLESLANILKNEHEVLIQGTADEISQVAQDKQTYMRVISEDATKYFNNFNEKAENNLEQSLKMLDVICVKKKILAWNESQKLLHFCRDLSDENSINLANRLKSTNNALNTLYSLTGINQTNTYDNSGHSKHTPVSRQLASV